MSLISELGLIRQEARELEKELEKTKQDLKDKIGRKNELLDKIRNLNQQIDENQLKRDQLNTQVKETKSESEKTLVDLEKLRNEVRTRESLVDQYRAKYRIGEGEARKRLSDLEWRLVTEHHNPKTESSIVAEIERLRSILSSFERAKAMDKTAEEYRKKMAEFKNTINEMRNRRSMLAQQSDQYHRLYIESKEAKKAAVDELEETRSEIQRLFDRKNEVFMKLIEHDAKAHLIVSSLRTSQQFVRREKEKELYQVKEQIAEQVDQKLKERKSLSLDELKIYYEVKKSTSA